MCSRPVLCRGWHILSLRAADSTPTAAWGIEFHIWASACTPTSTTPTPSSPSQCCSSSPPHTSLTRTASCRNLGSRSPAASRQRCEAAAPPRTACSRRAARHQAAFSAPWAPTPAPACACHPRPRSHLHRDPPVPLGKVREPPPSPGGSWCTLHPPCPACSRWSASGGERAHVAVRYAGACDTAPQAGCLPAELAFLSWLA